MEYFFKEKYKLKSVIMDLIKNFKTKYDIQVHYLCCDNVGENVNIERVCKQEEMGMEFEYTALVSPQQSGHVEQKFPPLLIGYVPCSMDGFFCLSEKQLMGKSFHYCHHS